MFARLVFQPPTNSYAQTYFNTIIGVITGGITSNTQLDAAAFNRSSSIINTTTPSGWYLVDGSANLVGNAVFTTGGVPHVIASNLTDDPTRAKTLYITPGFNGNNYIDIVAIPMEGWDSNIKYASNTYFGSSASFASASNNYLAGVGSGAFNANNFSAVLNSANNNARAYNLAQSYNYQTGGFAAQGGLVTIISASNAHLLVANYLGSNPPTFLNYYFVTEYSRDDPWNTVANGYPSWLWEGACIARNASVSAPPGFGAIIGPFLGGAHANNNTINNGVQNGYGSSFFHQHFGALCRTYNASLNADISWVPMFDGARLDQSGIGGLGNPATAQASGFGSSWGITTRYMNWSNFWAGAVQQGTTQGAPDVNSFGRTADSATVGYSAPVSRGLAQVGNKYNFTGNYNTTRDINKNPAFAVAELRVTGWNQSQIAGLFNSNTIFNGGSITAVNPYLYAVKAGYNSLDEISFGGNTYMNLILNQAPAGNVMSSNILVLES